MSAPNMLWWLLQAMLVGSSKFRTNLWSISQILRTRLIQDTLTSSSWLPMLVYASREKPPGSEIKTRKQEP
ncbi:unnamed protein product [Arabidopsis lyrata]|nr:unnamed protein product [Arabidopsis lyrata]